MTMCHVPTQTTALVEACIQGHTSCVVALFAAGANPNSKWQHLTPIQWASTHGNQACQEACRRGGGQMRPLPVGMSSASDEENCLRAPPLQRLRARRKQHSVHAAPAPTVGAGDDDSGRISAGPHWSGHEWVGASLLAAVEGRGEHANRSEQLKQRYPCLAGLGGAVRAYLFPLLSARSRPKLPPGTAASLSLRPGLRLRRKDASSADIDRRVRAARCVAPIMRVRTSHARDPTGTAVASAPPVVHVPRRSTANAFYFGATEAAPHFVALWHDDPNYKYFFGELLLCFHFAHEGREHECVLVEYMWPKLSKEDGVPLHTRYTHG